MTEGKLQARVVADRAEWIREMLRGLQGLPLDSRGEFEADERNVVAAESYLRRALEGLFRNGWVPEPNGPLLR